MAMLATPKSSQIRKATTALVWIKRGDDLSETLFYGTAQVCHRGGVVQVYTLGSNMILQQVFSLGLKDFVPRAIVFGEMTGNEKDVMVFGLYSGDIKGNVNGASWNVGGLIGDAALHLEGGALCMDEPSTGVNIYRLDRRELVKSFPVKVTKPAMRSRQVAFVDEHKKEYKSVVSGSDHGMVYVFDRRSGDVEVLKVHADDWVQTVAAVECPGGPTIFAARSGDLVGNNNIWVWRKKRQQRFGEGYTMWGLHALVLVALIATFINQNFALIRMSVS
ncbi:hypothetical protein B0H15DRAFT_804502 [Mycena belliarum]|uniref:Uncharacterized protein n=1 Tax=Mycena belliarum TaxID=1033014 RepID=A0AAD6TTY6_9AGAR|nr:hypothetical protein B0H15DRAFT_804502 [Mycena belliae]